MTVPPRVLIAVEAGNSKTDVAVLREDGEILHVQRAGGYRPPVTGHDHAANRLRAAVEAALHEVGAPPVAVVGAYVANVDYPVEERQLQDRILSWGLTDRVVLGNDTLALLRSGLPDPVGVAVVCGAGTNGVGVGRGGEIVRFPALGTLTGDWGGGQDLSMAVMFHATRSEDGRGPETSLSELVAAHFGETSASVVAERLHLGALDESRLHELVPVLFEACAAGDAVAAGIVDRQAQEVVVLARAALDRAGLSEGPAPVVLGGGVLAARFEPLERAIVEGLARTHPEADVRVPELSPLYGAVLLTLDVLPADPTTRAAREQRVAAGLRSAAVRTAPPTQHPTPSA